MPSTLSELTSWERAKIRNKRRELQVRAEAGDPAAVAWLANAKAKRTAAQQRKRVARAKERQRKQILKDANLFYFYQPEIFYAIL